MQSVQWYPGHMAKAMREMEEKLKIVDIVLELIDARIPLSSQNPSIDQTLKQKNKPRLVILNKIDMADAQVNKEWLKYFEDQGVNCLLVDSNKGINTNKITNICKEVLKEKLEREKMKGLKPRSIRTMVIGIPNVGKSTLINKLVGRNTAITGNKPGVTKAQQWIRINKDLDLLDTPGVLWPKFDDLKVGYNLAITGAIKDDILHRDDMVLYFLDFLRNSEYKQMFEDRYGVSLDNENVSVLDEIAKNRAWMRNGYSDYERVYDLILNDFRSLKLGHISIERP